MSLLHAVGAPFPSPLHESFSMRNLQLLSQYDNLLQVALEWLPHLSFAMLKITHGLHLRRTDAHKEGALTRVSVSLDACALGVVGSPACAHEQEGSWGAPTPTPLQIPTPSAKRRVAKAWAAALTLG
jgi:hypothetical protein